MVNGNTALSMTSCTCELPIMTSQWMSALYGTISTGLTQRKNTARPSRPARGLCILLNAMTRMKRGCHCLKRPMQRRMVITLLLKVDL